MLLNFSKMHGNGNDFMIIDRLSQHVALNKKIICGLANRKEGVGFDQLLLVEAPLQSDLDFFYRIYNADGSQASQCGNGTRCFAKYVFDKKYIGKTKITLQTISNTISVEYISDNYIITDMGRPNFLPTSIPFKANEQSIVYPLNINGQEINISALSMGNPHAVLLTETIENIPVTQLGSMISNHEKFPQRCNVSFMEILDKNNIKLRVFERGVGETEACGTAACAAIATGRVKSLLYETVTVHFPNQTLQVKFQDINSSIQLIGSATTVYQGQINIPDA